MHDYKEKAKEIILKYFSPLPDEDWKKIYHTTASRELMLSGIMPEAFLDQHDIFDILTELGFKVEKVEDLMSWAMFEK